MPSTNKTANFNLPQFVSTDKPNMQDFNEAFKSLDSSWAEKLNTFSYASADAPSFTMSAAGDLTNQIYPGIKIKLTQSTIKYFIVTAVSYASPNTTVTLYGGTDYVLTSAAISNVCTSTAKAPQEFPLNPDKWSIIVADSIAQTASSVYPTFSQAGTLQETVPIGAWKISLKGTAFASAHNKTDIGVYAGLSPTINPPVYNDLLASTYTLFSASNTDQRQITAPLFLTTNVSLTTKTTFYVIMAQFASSYDSMKMRGDLSKTFIKAECAYL